MLWRGELSPSSRLCEWLNRVVLNGKGESVMHNRKFLIKQNANILAEQNAWSTAYTEAYLAGRHHHRLGKPLGAYARVGIDEYALGYRAGYFERKNPESTKVQTSEMAETPVKVIAAGATNSLCTLCANPARQCA